MLWRFRGELAAEISPLLLLGRRRGWGMRRLELDMRWQAPEDFAKHLRRASTPAEYLMWQLVRNRQRCQAKFRRQHKLGPYVVDFFCPEARLVLECDGLPHFTQEGIDKDRIRTQWLNRQAIEVIRFTSHEIENDTQHVVSAIDMALKRLLKQDAPPHPRAPSPPEEEKGS